MLEVPTEIIRFKECPDVEIALRREDLIHPLISGNKFRKLKYNIVAAKDSGYLKILTFGGAYSNHILATAYACYKNGIQSIGIIRGDELKGKNLNNPTLKQASSFGMRFQFVSREQYRLKDTEDFKNSLEKDFGSIYILPEGGTNTLAVKGCSEILLPKDANFDIITCSVGTGGTLAGLINASKPNQKVYGFPALKGDFLSSDICKFASTNNWDLISDYHFGGYAKINEDLIAFINDFKSDFNIPLDPVYTAKMMYGLKDLVLKGYFPKNTSILAIHTGGLQGIVGMNMRLKLKKMPLIDV